MPKRFACHRVLSSGLRVSGTIFIEFKEGSLTSHGEFNTIYVEVPTRTIGFYLHRSRRDRNPCTSGTPECPGVRTTSTRTVVELSELLKISSPECKSKRDSSHLIH